VGRGARDDPAELGGGGEQRTGLGRVQPLDRGDVAQLTRDRSIAWPASNSKAPGAGREQLDRGGCAGADLGERAERCGEQAIAGEDRDRLAERDVHRRPAASHVVVVHRRRSSWTSVYACSISSAAAAGNASWRGAPHASAAAISTAGRSRLPCPVAA